MIREIVHIDEEKCDGCGLCVPSCQEGAIQIIDGKAKLLAENLCDGLGNCLGECPQGAITIEQRQAEAFDEQAVEEHLGRQLAEPYEPPTPTGAPAAEAEEAPAAKLPCGCPSTLMRKLQDEDEQTPAAPAAEAAAGPRTSKLRQFPVQLTLLPERGDVWADADVLLAADCVGFCMPDFHEKLLAGKTLAVACPKLDDAGAYVEKLARVLAGNRVKSITVARMEVPCCGGLGRIVKAAMDKAGANVPVTEVIVSTKGRLKSVNGVNVG